MSVLDPAVAAFIQGSVSIVLASADAGRTPCLARAVGCRVVRPAGVVRVFVRGDQAAGLLEAIQQTAGVAAVFSEPSSNRTVQLKGADAAVCPLEPEDELRMRTYQQAMVAELGSVGFGEAWVRAFLACQPAQASAIVFSVDQAFRQTPGAGAGERLQPGAIAHPLAVARP